MIFIESDQKRLIQDFEMKTRMLNICFFFSHSFTMVLKKKKKSTYIDSCWFYNVTIAQNHNESKLLLYMYFTQNTLF